MTAPWAGHPFHALVGRMLADAAPTVGAAWLAAVLAVLVAAVARVLVVAGMVAFGAVVGAVLLGAAAGVPTGFQPTAMGDPS